MLFCNKNDLFDVVDAVLVISNDLFDVHRYVLSADAVLVIRMIYLM